MEKVVDTEEVAMVAEDRLERSLAGLLPMTEGGPEAVGVGGQPMATGLGLTGLRLGAEEVVEDDEKDANSDGDLDGFVVRDDDPSCRTPESSQGSGVAPPMTTHANVRKRKSPVTRTTTHKTVRTRRPPVMPVGRHGQVMGMRTYEATFGSQTIDVDALSEAEDLDALDELGVLEDDEAV